MPKASKITCGCGKTGTRCETVQSTIKYAVTLAVTSTVYAYHQFREAIYNTKEYITESATSLFENNVNFLKSQIDWTITKITNTTDDYLSGEASTTTEEHADNI